MVNNLPLQVNLTRVGPLKKSCDATATARCGDSQSLNKTVI